MTLGEVLPRHLMPPTSNRVIRFATVPQPASATLSLDAMRFLQSRGIRYVIPRVPSGFPPTPARQVLRAAEEHFSVGRYPRVREMAFIAIVGNTVLPLRHGLIVWAISFQVPKKQAPSGYFIAFVFTDKPIPIGAIR